ncbi:hypothetical protein Tco_0355886 [Tanacetum coccineum]
MFVILIRFLIIKRPSRLNSTHVIVPSVEDRLVVYIVDNVLVSGVEEIIRMKFVLHAVMKLKKSFVHDSNPNSFIDSTNNFNPPPQPQYQTNSCELCGNDAHFGYDCPTQVPDPLIQQHEQAVQKEQEEQAAFTPYWRIPIIDDDDDEYTIQYKEYLENSSKAITPDLSTEEPDNSLSMGDEHLDTILETESDEELAEYINSPSWNCPAFYDDDDEYTIQYREYLENSIEDLVPIPSESKGIFDDTCDVPFCDNSPPLDILNDHFEIFSDFNDDCTSSDDDSFENINYIEASPPDSELVSLEEVKDDILREKLLNINLLIAKIESLKDNSTPDCVLKSPSPFPIPVKDSDFFFKKSDTSLSYSDNSLPKFETFSDHTKETSSGSTTTHADKSLPEYDSFHFEIEPDQGELSNIVMEDILGEPRVHMPNVLPTHPTLMLDSDFIHSDDSLGSYLEVSFPSGTRNKIFDPGIFFGVQSKRFLSRDTFSPIYVSLPFEERHYLSFTYVIRIFLPYFTYSVESLFLLSSGSEDIIFDPGITALSFYSLGPVDFLDCEDSRARDWAEEEELTEQQKQRKAQVQFEAQHYTKEDWDAIRAKLEANAELAKSVIAKDMSEEDFAKRIVTLVNQRKKYFAKKRAKKQKEVALTQSTVEDYMSNYLKNQGTWKLSS